MENNTGPAFNLQPPLPQSVSTVVPISESTPTPAAVPPSPPVADQQIPAKDTKSGCIKWLVISLAVGGLLVVGLVVALYFLGRSMIEKSPPIDRTNDYSTEQSQTDSDARSAPPSGFSWYKCDNMGSSFLRPDGWFVLQESDDANSAACFITKEEIAGGGQFKTGLTVNFNKEIKAKSGSAASEYALAFIDKLESQGNAGPISPLNGYDRAFTGAYRFFEKGDLKVYYAALGNDAEDEVYVISFESPTEEWEGTWNSTGLAIIRNLAIGAGGP